MSKLIDLVGLSRFLTKCKELFLSKEDAAVIKGTGENSVQQKGTGAVASGSSSVAEGSSTTASHIASHAEGNRTRAFGYGSHAEGNATVASGDYSHAEGRRTTANGNGAHAEGYNSGVLEEYNVATGNGAHAEGYNTIANGDGAHAEGGYNTASGSYSHAEGERTTAQNRAEHSQGQYNKSNKASNTFGDAGNTIHSVGIGTDSTKKKNAFEIMQNGDAYLFGVGGYDGTNPGASGVSTLQSVVNNSGGGGGAIVVNGWFNSSTHEFSPTEQEQTTWAAACSAYRHGQTIILNDDGNEYRSIVGYNDWSEDLLTYDGGYWRNPDI